MQRAFIRLGTAVAIAMPLAAGAQSGGFLVRLGSDTVTIERFDRSADKIDGSIVRRTPQTSVLKYTIGLNRDGSVASYEQVGVFRADGTPMPNQPAALKMTFTGDSVIRQVVQNNQPVTLRSAAPKGTLPAIGGSWLLYELMIQSAKRNGAAYTIGFNARQTEPTKMDIQLIGNDSAEYLIQGFRTGFKLDRDGHVQRGDGSLTTQKFIATPVRSVDVAAIASAWAARDAAGQAMGVASTRDTVNATLGAAHLWIDYGRPAARGREIWGKLVPFDTTWRMGANGAAQLKTDRDLVIGNVTVPAGFYTIWLYPSAGQSYLIVSKMVVSPANKANPVWGTEYNANQDFARIPVERHMNLPTSDERFHIFVQGDMLMMHWANGGYGVKIAAK